jgi:hypothetical protein
MKTNQMKVFALGFAISLILAVMVYGQDLQQLMQQKAAALKQSAAQNQAALHHYTWTEKTQISLKGEVKSTKVDSCQYGPDGKVHKTSVSAPPPPEKKRGLKGKIVEKKTDEMKDYMDRAVALIGRYVPPSPNKIQAVLAAGKASLSQAGPGAMQLIFKDYVKTGDAVTFTVDSAAKVIRQLAVNTYLDEQDKDAISLTVNFETLPDGTNCAAGKVLNVEAKKIVVNVEDSNYKKLAQ